VERDQAAILRPMADELTATRSEAVVAHEDVSAAVYAVIPPRRVPLAKRAFWRVVLYLLRHRRGRAWLAATYGGRRGG